MTVARKGKIASFPLAIREEVNRRLLDGHPGSKILPWLNGLADVLQVLDERFGEEPVTPQNLSEWRQGGYEEWLQRREQVQRLGELAKFASELGQAAGGNLTDGSAAIIGGKILERLETAESDEIGELTKALVALRGTDLEARKAQQRERLLDQKQRLVELSEKQFQLRSADLFLKWYEDRRAAEIAEGKAKRDVKIEQLRLLMFGEEETPNAGETKG
jgi:hypothetical protein